MTYRDTSRARALAVAAIAALVTGSSLPPSTRRARRPRPRRRRRRLTAGGRAPTSARRRADPHLSAAGGELGRRRRWSPTRRSRISREGAAKPTSARSRSKRRRRCHSSERLVKFTPLKITEANFRTLSREQMRDLIAEIDASIPEDERVIALDRVLAGLDKSQIIPKNVDGVKADPPPIFYSTKPAVLVNFDGEPIWSPIKDNDLKFAVNTNWDVFQHEQTKTYYLRHDEPLAEGERRQRPVDAGGHAARQFRKLPDDEQLDGGESGAARQSLPRPASDGVREHDSRPSSFCCAASPSYDRARHAAALGEQHGQRRLPAGQDRTGLLPVSGRWFSAPAFNGPWTFVTPTLPPDFKRIPLEHPRSRVLASVPGTPQAAEAVLLAQVPQTARVERKTCKAPEVRLSGRPGVRADRKTTRRARRQHRQGHHQGRRPVLHVLPGRLVHGPLPERPVGSHRLGAGSDLRDSGELARRTTSPTSPSRRQRRRLGDVRGRRPATPG